MASSGGMSIGPGGVKSQSGWKNVFDFAFTEGILADCRKEVKGDDIVISVPRGKASEAIGAINKVFLADADALFAEPTTLTESGDLFRALFGRGIALTPQTELNVATIFDPRSGAYFLNGVAVSAPLDLDINERAYQRAMEALAWRFRNIGNRELSAILTRGEHLPEITASTVDAMTADARIPFDVALVRDCILFVKTKSTEMAKESSSLHFDARRLWHIFSAPAVKYFSTPEDDQFVQLRLNKRHVLCRVQNLLKSPFLIKMTTDGISGTFIDDTPELTVKPPCLVFVVDKSESLKGSPFDLMKGQISRSLVKLSQDDVAKDAVLIFVFFSTAIGGIKTFKFENLAEMQHFIVKQAAAGTTKTAATIEEVMRYISAEQFTLTHNCIVTLISDGLDNHGLGSTAYYNDAQGVTRLKPEVTRDIALSRDLIRSQIQSFIAMEAKDERHVRPQMNIVAIGDTVDEAYLRELARVTGGNYHPVALSDNFSMLEDQVCSPGVRGNRRVLDVVCELAKGSASTGDDSIYKQIVTINRNGGPVSFQIRMPFSKVTRLTINGHEIFVSPPNLGACSRPPAAAAAAAAASPSSAVVLSSLSAAAAASPPPVVVPSLPSVAAVSPLPPVVAPSLPSVAAAPPPPPAIVSSPPPAAAAAPLLLPGIVPNAVVAAEEKKSNSAAASVAPPTEPTEELSARVITDLSTLQARGAFEGIDNEAVARLLQQMRVSLLLPYNQAHLRMQRSVAAATGGGAHATLHHPARPDDRGAAVPAAAAKRALGSS